MPPLDRCKVFLLSQMTRARRSSRRNQSQRARHASNAKWRTLACSQKSRAARISFRVVPPGLETKNESQKLDHGLERTVEVISRVLKGDEKDRRRAASSRPFSRGRRGRKKEGGMGDPLTLPSPPGAGERRSARDAPLPPP